ncbi:MAG: hypothetical protein ACC657_05880 [Thiohalomonadales bacterium]
MIKHILILSAAFIALVSCGGGDTGSTPSNTVTVVPITPSITAVTTPTRSNTQTFMGEKGANNSIWINGVEKVPMDTNTTWTVVDIPLNEGSNKFTVFSQDSAATKSAMVTATIVLDSTPPLKPAVTSTLFTNVSGYTLVGSKDANSSIWINDVEEIATNTNTTWSFAVSLAEGNNLFSLTSRDALGNVTAVVTETVVLDMTPPVAPGVNIVATPTNSNPYTLSGSKESGASIWINGALIVASDSSTNWTTNVALNVEGANTFTVSSKDAAGNSSLSTTSVTIVLDSTAPLKPTLTSSLLTSNTAYTLAGAKDVGASIWIGGTVAVAANNSATWSFAATLNEGNNSFSVTSRDVVGNESTAATATVVLDTTPPAKPSVTSALLVNTSTYALLGNKDPGTSIWINGTEQVVANNDTVWSVSSTLVEGDNSYSITARDALGNETVALSVIVVLDTIPPSVPTITSNLRTNQISYTLTGTRESRSSILINGIEVVASGSRTTWSSVVTLSTGSNIYSVTSRDALGNESGILSVTVDMETIPPGQVTNFTATKPRSTALRLDWINPGDVDFAGVRVLRSTANFATGHTDTIKQTNELQRNVSGFTDSQLLNGVAYYYSAYAYDNYGNYSSSATTLKTIPGLPGDLDQSFNLPDGFTIFGLDKGPSFRDYGYAVAVQSDGKIIVVGSAYSDVGSDDMAIFRFTSAGILDTTFNSVGYVTHDGAGQGISNSTDKGLAVALQSDGKIVVAGYGQHRTGGDVMVVWRYTQNGLLDSSFNGQGYVAHSTGPLIDNTGVNTEQFDLAYAVAVQADGKIIVTGVGGVNTTIGSTKEMILWRFTTDGKLDTSFNTKGWATHNGAATAVANSYADAKAMVIQTDGNIIVAGSRWDANSRGMILWRYTTAGILDQTFNTTGFVTSNNATNDSAYDVALQSDGNIVVVGDSWASGFDTQMIVWRYTSTGILDTNFNTTGWVTHPGVPDTTGYSNDARGVAIQADGKIVVTGNSDSTGRNPDMTLWRYTNAGSLDTTFSTTGIVIGNTSVSSNESAHGVVLQTEGNTTKIVVVGNTNIVDGSNQGFGSSDINLWRYLP